MRRVIALFGLTVSIGMTAQNYTHFTTTEGKEWQQSKVSLSGKAAAWMKISYTPEFYAVKHFSHLVPPGSRIQGYVPREQTQGMPVIVFQRPDKKYVVIVGNQNNEQRTATVKLGKKFLNMTLPAHSMHTYIASK